MSVPIITIDGPSGSGKGTVARLIAKALRWHYLESGALYRVLAFASIKHDIQEHDVERLVSAAKELPVKFNAEDETRILWSHHDVTDEIHTEYYGNLASKIASITAVRQALLSRQRIFAVSPGLVTDGRDMGTVVFPGARLKFFLLADRQERAKRRHAQLKGKGIHVSLEEVLQDLTERDFRDEHREISPLRPAEGAIMIDTTSLSVEQSFQKFMQYVQEVFGTLVNE